MLASPEHNELQPIRQQLPDGTVVDVGDTVYVNGIGNKYLGRGIYAGSLVLRGRSGSKWDTSVIDVQGRLVSGGEVDLWTNHSIGDEDNTYPIDDYLVEIRARRAQFMELVDTALASEMGVRLD